MSGESSKRSNLIDVSYSQLHATLSGQQDGTPVDQLVEYVTPRLEQLRNIAEPFGKPSDASKKKIDGGAAVLSDGVTLRIEDADKEYVLAVSNKFQIDQVQAFILLRSFFYNKGLPSTVGANESSPFVDELLAEITPFYFSERLSVLRVLLPLFRAKADPDDPLCEFASTFIPKLIPDGPQLAELLVAEFTRKSRARVAETIINPKEAAREAKQNSAEQLVLLEVLFATMWDYVKCDGTIVTKIYEAAYATQLGRLQANSSLLLDDESLQLSQDIATMWTLIMIEILELEALADPSGTIEISASPKDTDVYTASPRALQRIHELVTSNDDGQYSCIYLAWAFVLSRFAAAAHKQEEIPDSYRSFFELIVPQLHSAYSKDREPMHTIMTRTCLMPDVGLFSLMLSFLTDSPVFVASVAWKRASSVTDPNAAAYRSVLKGLVIAILELTPVETIPEFETFIEVWISLFGRSESKSVALICAQYWESDWHVSSARRAIFDVTRARFPIQFKPLIRLLRSMTGAGFLDTDPLCSTQEGPQTKPASQATARDSCARHVFYYLDTLSTFSQIVPTSSSTGPHALYERQPERYGHPHTPIGLSYANQRPIRLPGGSTLLAGSPGRLLNGDGAEFLVVCWQHTHSGWKVVLEVLTDYVNKRRIQSGGGYQDVSFAPRGAAGQQAITLRAEDVGVEIDGGGVDERVITDALDLVQSLIRDNPAQAEQLIQAFEAGEPVVAHTMTEAQPPDLVQLTTMILEEALTSSAYHNNGYRAQLITCAMSVLSAILALPLYAHRVWLYVRSTAALFGADRSVGFASVALAAERVSGRYTMTLALLYLVQQLALEAFSSILPDNPRLQQLKEEVLLRAIRFVHAEIWVEHLGWKYTQKAERFDIGRQVMTLDSIILEHAPPVIDESPVTFPFASLLQAVLDLLLFKATTSTINPTVSSITAGLSVLESLYNSRLLSDVRRLIFSLTAHLRLARLVLNIKINSPASNNRPCLLEQVLCTRVTSGAYSRDSHSFGKADPIDVLALYVKHRSIGTVVPLEAVRVLSALCTSFSMVSPYPPTIIAHLSNPEAMTTSLVQIIQHPYEDMTLRSAVWSFISLAVDAEPAMGTLFVVGQFGTPAQHKGKATKAISDRPAEENQHESALDIATNMLDGWYEMWEMNPQLLASVLRFLEVVWQHGLEHRGVLQPLRESSSFWESITKLACAELGPPPEYETGGFDMVDGIRRATHHEVISMHAYRTRVKSYALRIIAHDIGIHFSINTDATKFKPPSFVKMEPHFRSSEDLGELLLEASPSSYDPGLYDRLSQQLDAEFPSLTLEQVRSSQSAVEREFGDDYIFSTALFRTRLHAYRHKTFEEQCESLVAQLHLINMNLSLTHSQTALAEAWQLLLRKTIPYLRGDATVRPLLMTSAASMSYDIAAEKRSGDMMATIHGTRLALLLAVLEVIWFATTDKTTEVASFIELVHNVHNIILNEAQPPSKLFLGAVSVPFHRTLLLILYFSAKNCGILGRRPKALNADQRLKIASMIDTALMLVIDALRVVFVSARSRLDVELDRDMELLVSVFDQCTRPDINPSSTLWLIRCQETDIIRGSLDLYVHIDLVGLSDLPLLLARKQPLYAPHVLLFHMTLAGIPSAAERFAGEGVLAAYSNNSLSAAISAGMVDVTLPELPTHRSPAHSTYCSMLGIISGVVTALGRHNHYFDAEASGLIQLYGEQISRALSWTIGDSITLPLVEELEQVVNVFYSIAQSAPLSPNISSAVEKVLHAFPPHALHLLQQLNYALTHPNHLASLFEPITSDERALLDKHPLSTEPLKRPLIAYLVHRLFRLSSNIISTLVTVSRAYTVLTGDKDDWPVHEALILPHSKVVLGEQASMGTLLELGNCTLDVLRDLVNRPVGQSLADVGPLPGTNPLDVREGVSTARRNLEALLIYAVTQLAMSLSKPDVENINNSGNDMDMDEHVQPDAGREERRAPRASLSLADRLRRGVTGEMAADLQALLNKAKPVIAKSDAVLESPGVDLTGVLSNFLQERIISPGQ
ncbi:nucleoporin subcomplex protein binding to Pom34-domain-containing protein [Mycena pura]|uniref:Nucleoporin subcomplex protein binding to Pom34-domain-containing protein n=1 Tax=Mycena pura TaxID=153505 RepID=A0AAD6Y5A0_9AGAR|nr:nucleoporin subcomplex protein binding to Pom34-domain-containing protein [Mycena pura]